MLKTILPLRILLLVVAILLSQFGSGQTTLQPGDIAILGFNADDVAPNQRWAFLVLRNLSAGTIINFTDAGYDATTSEFRTGATNEGHMRWTLPSAIPVGTIIYGTNTTINGATTGVTGQLGSGSLGFHPSGDQIFVYQGTLGTATGATFIYALNTGQAGLYGSDGNWLPAGSGSISSFDHLSYAPPGLSSPYAVALTSNVGNTSSGSGTTGSPNYGFDNMYYAGTTSGSRTQILTALANPSNWAGNDASGNFLQSGSGSVYPSGTFTILPVNLIAYTAQLQSNGSVKISWSTTNEVNNSHFLVERSNNGVSFTTMGRIEGKGNTTALTEYEYLDRLPLPGTNYYRLTQVDKDERSKIFEIKTVVVPSNRVIVYPNPATTEVRAKVTPGLYKQVQLLNQSGQVLQLVQFQQNEREIKFSLAPYTSGTYYLQFEKLDGSKELHSFIKSK